jgi:outer membrane protein
VTFFKYPKFISGLFVTFALFAGTAHGKSTEIGLAHAVKSALQNNLNLQLRKEDVIEVEGTTESAQGKFDTLLSASTETRSQEFTPQFSGDLDKNNSTTWNAGLKKRFTPGTEIDLSWNNGFQETSPAYSLIDPVYKSNLVLSIRQPLLKGFGKEIQTAELQASLKQQEATSYLVDSEAADLIAEVKKAYWELVYTWQDIEVQKLSLQLAKKLLEEIREKIRAGKLAEVEIFRPESEVARREENLITSEKSIGFAEDNLKFLINSKEWSTSLIPKDLPEMPLIHPDLPSILKNALANRPDLKAANLVTESAKISAKKSRDDLRPDLALQGSIGTGGTDDNYSSSLGNTIDDPDALWSVGIQYSIPLNNSLAKGQHRTAKAALRKAQTRAELLRQQIRRTVRTTVRDVNLAIKAMEASHKTTIATQKGLEAEEVKFEAGRATSLDVLVAQETYSQALSQEKRAQIVYAQALAELDRIQGLVTIPTEKSIIRIQGLVTIPAEKSIIRIQGLATIPAE